MKTVASGRSPKKGGFPQVIELRRASRDVVRELGLLQKTFGPLELPHTQCHALLELEANEQVNILDLAKLLRLDKSTASRVSAEIVKQGWANRLDGTADKRLKTLSLTPLGRLRVQEIHRAANAQVEMALASLSPEDRDTVVKGMELYAKALARARAAKNLQIRPITSEDDPAICAIIHKVMPEFGASGPGFAIHDPEVKAMSVAYRKPRHSYFVVTDGFKVVGGGGIAPLEGGGPHDCELRKMYFLPEARGLGLGQRLLELCLKTAREKKFSVCYLETMKNMARAQALYQRLGFERLVKPMGKTGHFGCDVWYAKRLG